MQNVTDIGNTKYYIPPEDRIAVFDNDGTLWLEKIFLLAFFILDRLEELSKTNPQIEDNPQPMIIRSQTLVK